MNIPVTRPRGRPSEYPGLLLDYFSENPGNSVDDFKKWFGTEDSYVYKIVMKMVDEGLLERLPGTGRYTRCRAAKPAGVELVAILSANGPMTLDAVGPLYGCPPTYLLESAQRLRADGRIRLSVDGTLSVPSAGWCAPGRAARGPTREQHRSQTPGAWIPTFSSGSEPLLTLETTHALQDHPNLHQQAEV